MADRYLLESGAPDGYLLEDGSGVLLLEQTADTALANPESGGLTRDVSASGAFFETDASYRVGNVVRFAINLDTPWGPAQFDYRGKIVRLERHDGTVGVAVRGPSDLPPPVRSFGPPLGR